MNLNEIKTTSIEQDERIAKFTAIAKELPEIEKQVWLLNNCGSGADAVNLGVISASDAIHLGNLINIENEIQSEAYKAGAAIKLPDLDTNEEYPKEYIEAKKRLAELDAPYQNLKQIREAVYHAGSTSYHWLIYNDPVLAAEADKLAEKIYHLKAPLSDERLELTAYVERRERSNSKVRIIRDRLWRSYQTAKGMAENARREELEKKYAAELAEKKRIEDQVEVVRQYKIACLAARFKAVMAEANQALAGADLAGEPVLDDPSYQQKVADRIKAGKVKWTPVQTVKLVGSPVTGEWTETRTDHTKGVNNG